jgi:hypothetical protein
VKTWISGPDLLKRKITWDDISYSFAKEESKSAKIRPKPHPFAITMATEKIK